MNQQELVSASSSASFLGLLLVLECFPMLPALPRFLAISHGPSVFLTTVSCLKALSVDSFST